MKRHVLAAPLALLAAAFLLGCQEQGSDPFGPEGLGPEFRKPGSDATYTATFTGDIKGDNIKLIEGLNTGDALLDLSFFQAAPSDGGYTAEEGAICFVGDPFTPLVLFSIREGKKNDPWDAVAGPLTFNALGTDKTTVKYGLNLYGMIDQGELPPDKVTNLIITWERFDIFNQGRGKHVACTGTGSLNSVVEVTNTT